jgi:hypothetical protein
MAKWADYLISGIWQTTTSGGSKIVSYVFLHEDTEEDFHSGKKTSREAVPPLLLMARFNTSSFLLIVLSPFPFSSSLPTKPFNQVLSIFFYVDV